MSRQAAALILAGALLTAGADAVAQQSGDPGVNAMITTERKTYGAPPPRRKACNPGEGGDIVVCAPDHGEDQRVPSSTAADPTSRAALRDGRAHAPQLDQGYCAKCKHFGRVPARIYYFDIKSLPEAPAGSDADKIAKGEATEP